MTEVLTLEEFEVRLKEYRRIVVQFIPSCYADERLAYEAVRDPYAVLTEHITKLEAACNAAVTWCGLDGDGIGQPALDQLWSVMGLPALDPIEEDVRAAREHAADAIGSGYDPADDMTVELAVELVEKDRRIAELEELNASYCRALECAGDYIAQLEEREI